MRVVKRLPKMTRAFQPLPKFAYVAASFSRDNSFASDVKVYGEGWNAVDGIFAKYEVPSVLPIRGAW